jgi:hypothetical protein
MYSVLVYWMAKILAQSVNNPMYQALTKFTKILVTDPQIDI